jgi:hypothetical protein
MFSDSRVEQRLQGDLARVHAAADQVGHDRAMVLDDLGGLEGVEVAARHAALALQARVAFDAVPG